MYFCPNGVEPPRFRWGPDLNLQPWCSKLPVSYVEPPTWLLHLRVCGGAHLIWISDLTCPQRTSWSLSSTTAHAVTTLRMIPSFPSSNPYESLLGSSSKTWSLKKLCFPHSLVDSRCPKGHETPSNLARPASLSSSGRWPLTHWPSHPSDTLMSSALFTGSFAAFRTQPKRCLLPGAQSSPAEWAQLSFCPGWPSIPPHPPTAGWCTQNARSLHLEGLSILAS